MTLPADTSSPARQSPAPREQLSSAVAVVQQALSRPDYRPPRLPATVLEIHRLAASPRVSFEDAVAVLERDPQFASEVLRLARSPAFLTRVAPSSLNQAVSLLGMNRLRDLAFAIAYDAKVFRAPGYDSLLEAVRQHSVASAQVARTLAKNTPHADDAFLCGLLHDLGISCSLVILAEQPRLCPPVLAETLRAVHEKVGAWVAEMWHLPEEVAAAASGHHHPSRSAAALACVANHVARHVGYGLPSGIDELDEASLASACDLLGLGPEDLEELIQKMLSSQAGPLLGD